MTAHADRDRSEQPRMLFAHRLAEQGHKIDPLNALLDAIVFSSADWGAARDLAFIYGIVVGWDGDPGDDPEDEGDAMTELAQKFGWSETGVQRLRAMHEVYAGLRTGQVERALADERAKVARVEALHAKDDDHWCTADGFDWPCPTVRALVGSEPDTTEGGPDARP